MDRLNSNTYYKRKHTEIHMHGHTKRKYTNAQHGQTLTEIHRKTHTWMYIYLTEKHRNTQHV
jgi:hypothetical protein